MKKFDLNEFSNNINNLTIDELRSLNSLVVKTIKFKQSIESSVAKDEFRVGDEVRFNSNANLKQKNMNLMKATFTIVKINRTKVAVRENGQFITYSVPANWLERV